MLHRPDSVSKREEKPGALKVLIDLLFAISIVITIVIGIVISIVITIAIPIVITIDITIVIDIDIDITIVNKSRIIHIIHKPTLFKQFFSSSEN